MAVRTVAPPRPAVVLAVLVTCQLMLVLDLTVTNVALPSIQADLHFSSAGLSWVVNAYTLVFGGLLLLGGRAGDLFGRRRLFVGGLVLFTVASLAGGLATSAGMLLAARIVQGVGAAAAGPSTLALITTTFTEPRQRIRALAVFSGMASGGFAIGLIVGGVLTTALTWRAVFFINVPVGAVVVALALHHLAETSRPDTERRLDLAGAGTATVGAAGLVYGCVRAVSAGWTDAITLGALAVGVVALVAFVLVESRVAQPLLPLRLFADRNRAAAYVCFFLGPMAMMTCFFFLTQFLQDVLRLSPLATGIAFLPLAAPQFAMTRLVPVLLPRTGPKPLVVTGGLVLVAGLVWLTRLTPASGYLVDVLGPLVVLGVGAGIGFAPLNVVIMGNVEPRDSGAAGGVLQTMQNMGATLGLAVLATVFGIAQRHAAGQGVAPALVAGMTHAITVGVGFAVASVVVALTFRPR
ncbi:MAG TPA: MFS transporter [Pseudonocardiaceae bacterium]|nr:MFS transporter [Pseudonocardiaceae bacterium]